MSSIQCGPSWQPKETAPKDGAKILARSGDHVFLTQWVEDIYAWQGGSGGRSGWFSGVYDDHWGDRPRLDEFDEWCNIPL